MGWCRGAAARFFEDIAANLPQATPRKCRADARRDRWLEREGWRVLRLSAEEVLADARAAAAKVRAALG